MRKIIQEGRPEGRPGNKSRRQWVRACALALLVVLPGALPLPLRAAGPASAPKEAVLLVLGDSISAEYGLKRGTGWVALLEARLTQQKKPVRVVNASISGDTTAGGRSRLPALLAQHRPTHVVIELGGNDALRGLALDMTEANLAAMTDAARAAGAQVLLVGIQVPPNYGRAYTERFAGLFEKVAKVKKVAVMPFILQGVADGPQAARLMQADRIHPNEEAQPRLLDNVWPALQKLLASP
jgi:acyl-CoA thioesterase-1